MGGKTVSRVCATCRYNVTGLICHEARAANCDNGDLWAPRSQVPVQPDSGSNASYYSVQILHPLRGATYNAECQDIIEALGMDFNEGNAFKALWRRAAARTGKVKKGNEDPLYDAQKIEFYGKRILNKEQNK